MQQRNYYPYGMVARSLSTKAEKETLAYEEDYYVVVDLVHQKSLNYMDSLDNVNAMLAEEHNDEEFVPIIVPPTEYWRERQRCILVF